MKDVTKNKDVVVLVKLTNRIPGHKASLSEDFNMIKQMYEAHRKSEIIKDWIEKKIKTTYVKIGEGWDACEFTYDGWVK